MVFAMAMFVATAVILSRVIREPGTFDNARVKESIYEHLFEGRPIGPENLNGRLMRFTCSCIVGFTLLGCLIASALWPR